MSCLRADGAEPKPCAAIVAAASRRSIFCSNVGPEPVAIARRSPFFVMVGSGAAAASGTPTRRPRILLKPLPVARHIATASVRGIGREVPWCPTRHVRRTACHLFKAPGVCSLTGRAHASGKPEHHSNPESPQSLGGGHAQHA